MQDLIFMFLLFYIWNLLFTSQRDELHIASESMVCYLVFSI